MVYVNVEGQPESFVMGCCVQRCRRSLRLQRETGRGRLTESQGRRGLRGVFDLREKGFRPVSLVLGKRGCTRYFGFLTFN